MSSESDLLNSPMEESVGLSPPPVRAPPPPPRGRRNRSRRNRKRKRQAATPDAAKTLTVC